MTMVINARLVLLSIILFEAFKEVQERDGVVHNEKRERDYWREEGTFFEPDNGTRPGQYSSEEINQIMDYRSQDDFYKDFKF